MRFIPMVIAMKSAAAFMSTGSSSCSHGQGLLSSYRLVYRLGRHFGVDDSHNHVHSKEVMFWAGAILENLSKNMNITLSQRLCIGHCALLHDVLDKKYLDNTSYPMVYDRVYNHLSKHFFSGGTARHMMEIMTGLSYSKTVSPDPQGGGHATVRFPSWIQDKPEWFTIYHIVREADLLSAYNIARMVEYRLSKFPAMSESDMRQDIRDMFYSRMDRMIEMGLFVHPSSAELASTLQQVARYKLAMLDFIDLKKISNDRLDILRCINTKYIPAEDIISKNFLE